MAEHEAEMISARTKAAARAKKRGTVLGGFRGKVPTAKHRALSAEARQRGADERAVLATTIKGLQANGATSLRAIAAALNEQSIPTARGNGRGPRFRCRASWRGSDRGPAIPMGPLRRDRRPDHPFGGDQCHSVAGGAP